MFSKIGGLLKTPAQPQGKSGNRDAGENAPRDRQEGAPESFTGEDAVVLSIAAIRALLVEEKSLTEIAPDLLRKLALLEQHGLQSLPVSPGQSVSEAILGAASYLSSSR